MLVAKTHILSMDDFCTFQIQNPHLDPGLRQYIYLKTIMPIGYLKFAFSTISSSNFFSYLLAIFNTLLIFAGASLAIEHVKAAVLE